MAISPADIIITFVKLPPHGPPVLDQTLLRQNHRLVHIPTRLSQRGPGILYMRVASHPDRRLHHVRDIDLHNDLAHAPQTPHSVRIRQKRLPLLRRGDVDLQIPDARQQQRHLLHPFPVLCAFSAHLVLEAQFPDRGQIPLLALALRALRSKIPRVQHRRITLGPVLDPKPILPVQDVPALPMQFTTALQDRGEQTVSDPRELGLKITLPGAIDETGVNGTDVVFDDAVVTEEEAVDLNPDFGRQTDEGGQARIGSGEGGGTCDARNGVRERGAVALSAMSTRFNVCGRMGDIKNTMVGSESCLDKMW